MMETAVSVSSSSDGEEDEEAPTLVALLESNDDTGVEQNNTPKNTVVEESSSLIPPCPVTILSGFLGAGKTTLVRYILQSPNHGKRIAVIENEFGGDEAGGLLQVESIIARDGLDDSSSLSDFIELPNGCICCTVKDSLIVTLENLLKKRSDLDYILIECSGMANPGPIAALFWLDEALESRLRLDGVVTLVDAANIERQLRETVEASQQIAYADRIILNKTDLLLSKNNNNNNDDDDVADDTIERIKDLIRTIHPTVGTIQTTTYSTIPDLDWILDARCFDADRAHHMLEEQHQQLAFHNAVQDDEHHHHDHTHDHGDDCKICAATSATDHSHTAAVSTVSLTVNGTVDIDKVHQWLASVLWPNQDENASVLRALVEGAIIDSTTGTATNDSQNPKTNNHAQSSSSTQQQHAMQQIFRIKGILSVRHAPESEEVLSVDNKNLIDADGIDRRRYIVQAVHDLWDIHASSSTDLQWNTEEDRCSRLIVIGRYLQVSELQQGFQACTTRE